MENKKVLCCNGNDYFFLGVQIGFQSHRNHSVETKLSCSAARWGRRTWSSAALVEEGRVDCLVQRVSHCFAVLLCCCVERDVPSGTVFKPLRRGSLCSGHLRIKSSNHVCLRFRSFSLWFEGITCLLMGFFWPTHFFFFSCDSFSINVFDGVSPVLAQMHQMFFHYILKVNCRCGWKNNWGSQHIPVKNYTEMRFRPTALTSELGFSRPITWSDAEEI